MRVEKCYFCGSPIYPGHGIQFMRNDCRIFKFCRSKCHRHFKKRHNPKKFKWTKAYRKTFGKELAYDKTLEFENRKEEPIRYNRDLVVKTIKAIKRIEEIKKARQLDHWKNRMRVARAKNPNQVDNVLEKHVTLIKDKGIRERVKRRIQKKRKEFIRGKKARLRGMVIEEASESEEEEEGQEEGTGKEEVVAMEEISEED